MGEQKNMHEKNGAGRKVFLSSVLVAIFFFLLLLGKPITMPFPWKLVPENPSVSMAGRGQPSVFIDNHGTRMVFTDTNRTVRSVVNLGSGDVLNVVNGVTYDGRSFYAWGVKKVRDSANVEFDRVVRYDENGTHPTVIYELPGNKESSYASTLPRICNVRFCNGKIYITMLDRAVDEGSHIQVLASDIDVSGMKTPEIILSHEVSAFDMACYVPETGSLLYRNDLGSVFRITDGKKEELLYENASAFICPDGQTVFWTDIVTGDLYRNDQVFMKEADSLCLSPGLDGFSYVSSDDGALYVVRAEDGAAEAVRELPYSFTFGLLTLLKFLSLLYLTGLVIASLVIYLRKTYRNGKHELLLKIGASVAVVLVLLGVSFYYTRQFVETDLGTTKDSMERFGMYFIDNIQADGILDPEQQDTPELRMKWYDTMKRYLGHYKEICARYDLFVDIALYRNEGNEAILYYTTENRLPDRIAWSLDSLQKEDIKVNNIRLFSLYGEIAYQFIMPITGPEGETLGFLELSQDYSSYRNQVYSFCFEMFLTLMMISIGIVLFMIEGKAFLTGLKRRRQAIEAKADNVELTMVRPAMFLFNLVTSFDSVILVLISREMLDISGVTGDRLAFLMTIPSLAMGIGKTLGRMVYTPLARRMTVRKLAMSGTLVMVVCYTAIIFTVQRNVFAVFCVLKLLCSLFYSVVFSILRTMPYRAATEEERYLAMQDKEIVGVSSSAFGTLIGGIASQNLGNTVMYTINTVAFLPVIAIFLLMMPAGTYYVQPCTERRTPKKSMKFLFSVPMVAYWVFLTLPIIAVSGYKSFLFPIYSSSLHWPKMYITTFSVLAKMIVILLAHPLISRFKNIHYWKKSVFLLLIMGASLLGFLLNTSIIWAVIMLVITELFDRLINPAREMLWPGIARQYQQEIVETANTMSLIESIFSSFKETLLAFFLMFGNERACMLLGACCILFDLIFVLLTRKTPMAEPGGSGT